MCCHSLYACHSGLLATMASCRWNHVTVHIATRPSQHLYITITASPHVTSLLQDVTTACTHCTLLHRHVGLHKSAVTQDKWRNLNMEARESSNTAADTDDDPDFKVSISAVGLHASTDCANLNLSVRTCHDIDCLLKAGSWQCVHHGVTCMFRMLCSI